jgi:hypothetical protein
MSQKDWYDIASEFYDVMRRKTEEENARRGSLRCPHDFKSAAVCPICVMHASLRKAEYDGNDDFSRSIDEAYALIRERKANGGKGWEPK